MSGNDKAQSDAKAVKALRAAGATMIGHTNMTELAYSGLGLNPHYGTPDNAIMPGRIPGGSTSGGAVSVAQGFADIALGTDTGGSLRIPAAFNGIVGFKPTQSTVPRMGCKALSNSLDSVGPMARTVSACKLAYEAMTSLSPSHNSEWNPAFVLPTNHGLDDLDNVVAEQFEKAVSSLSRAGYKIIESAIGSFDLLKALPAGQIVAVEAQREYQDTYNEDSESLDPRIYSRMAQANGVDESQYQQTLQSRQTLIEQYQKEMLDKIVLLPTVATLPPLLSEIQNDDERYNSANLLCLRNTSIANAVDGCSISLPYGSEETTIGIMLISNSLTDLNLLSLAAHVDKVLRYS